MARPNLSQQRREELIPVLAQAFADLGYRRATTATLARRCGLRENQLYRLWPDKKAIFLASIDYLYEYTAAKWRELLACDDGRTPSERILAWEGDHRGETGLHRITFAGLNEANDPEVREALRQMYQKFHTFIVTLVQTNQGNNLEGGYPDAALTAWAVIGLGMMANITGDLGLLSHDQRGRMVCEVGAQMFNSVPDAD
jgi:AcrR family transcriptional regulator